MNMIKNLLAAASLAAMMAPAMAANPVVLDFEGIAAPGTNAAIGNFYSGLGVTFSSNALAINGYNGSAEPTPTSVLFFLQGAAATLNYAAGFDTGFSFYFSSNTTDGNIQVFDGLNGTGNVLASIALPSQASSNCPSGSTGTYCTWTPIGVSFAGTAKSINFGGAANFIAFDNVTFGSAVPGVPEPSTYALMALGLAGIGFVARRRKSA